MQDFRLHVAVRDMAQCSRYIMESLLKHPSVQACRTRFVLQRVKGTTALALSCCRAGGTGHAPAWRTILRMLDWLHTLSTWLQSWATPEMGLWGLFGSAFLSATVLPGSSEVVLTALITAYPAQAWPGFWVALAGNLLGCLLTFGMGHAGRQGYERFQRVKVDMDGPQVRRLRRWGAPALVLAFLPLVGDALVLAAGWLKMPFWHSLAWIAVGKGLRYLLVVGGMLGLLQFA